MITIKNNEFKIMVCAEYDLYQLFGKMCVMVKDTKSNEMFLDTEFSLITSEILDIIYLEKNKEYNYNCLVLEYLDKILYDVIDKMEGSLDYIKPKFGYRFMKHKKQLNDVDMIRNIVVNMIEEFKINK